MANLFEQYGIKEVANVSIYEIGEGGARGNLKLFLDSLKVSTLEQTADQTEAKGGIGNMPLVIWDFGKEITLNVEDALFSPQSLSIMMGNGTVGSATTVRKTMKFHGATVPTKDSRGNTINIPALSSETNDAEYVDLSTGQKPSSLVESGTYVVSWDETVTGQKIEITPDSFPGTYYIVGETYARSAVTGKDEYFQFIIPKAKMTPERTITLQAEGDPTTFNMSLRVMRPDSGNMMEFIQYGLTEAGA